MSDFKKNTAIQARHDRKCAVCGEPAHFFSLDPEPICLRAECRLVLGKRHHMSENAFQQFFSLQSNQIKWNIRQAALKTQMLKDQREKEEKEYVSFLLRKTKDVHGAILTCPYTMIPKNKRTLSRLPKRRQKLFRDFLSNLNHEAFLEIKENKVNSVEQINPRDAVGEADPFMAGACAVCRGACCTTGWKDAFLKKETLFRFHLEHPDQMPGDVLDAYMAHLGRITFTDSCVYHTETGCCLPRSMRSDTCNEFLCTTLVDLDDLLNNTDQPRGIFLIEHAPESWREEILDPGTRLESRVHLLENFRDAEDHSL